MPKENNKFLTPKKPIVILGGGSTGLAVAYGLSELGEKAILIEKEKFLGGLSATRQHHNFFYEFGPHAFHLKDENIISWVKNLIGADFRVIPTKTEVIIDRQFLNYPLKADELVQKVNPYLGIKILLGYGYARLKNFFLSKEPRNFEEWGLVNFGPTLYRISFGDYTAKVWGMSPKKISMLLASQKLAKLNLGDIILKVLGFKGKVQPAYFKTFLYPKKGMSLLFAKMTKKASKNCQFILGAEVRRLKCSGGKVQSIEYADSTGKIKVLPVDRVISTITLKDLIPMFNKPLSMLTNKAAKRLIYRDMVIVYAVVRAKNLSLSQWIYLVEKQFFFNRVTLSQNLSPDFGPKDKTVLAFEVCCQAGDGVWQKNTDDWLEFVSKDLEKMGWKNLKIAELWVEHLKNAYPIFTVGFEKDLQQVLTDLKKVRNLQTIGRNGLFLNSDIHDCFKMGFETARKEVERNG